MGNSGQAADPELEEMKRTAYARSLQKGRRTLRSRSRPRRIVIEPRSVLQSCYRLYLHDFGIEHYWTEVYREVYSCTRPPSHSNASTSLPTACDGQLMRWNRALDCRTLTKDLSVSECEYGEGQWSVVNQSNREERFSPIHLTSFSILAQ